MANWGLTWLGILITVHTLFFFGGEAGVVDNQSPDNPHKKFVDNFAENDTLTDEAGISEDAGIVETTFSPVLSQNSFFQTVSGWLMSPYSSINATSFPPMLKLLLNALMGLAEGYTIYKFVRGGA